MPLPIEGITTAALSAALDAATLRHAATASNIANVHTQGYVPLRVGFDERLEEARAALRGGGRLAASHVDALRVELLPLSDGPVQGVHLDVEMAELARNSVWYQTLTQAVSRHLSMLALAAADGRK